jgi:hypothetical protein
MFVLHGMTASGAEQGFVAAADLVRALAQAHEEVVGLDVSVNEAAAVHVLYSRDLRRAWYHHQHSTL